MNMCAKYMTIVFGITAILHVKSGYMYSTNRLKADHHSNLIDDIISENEILDDVEKDFTIKKPVVKDSPPPTGMLAMLANEKTANFQNEATSSSGCSRCKMGISMLLSISKTDVSEEKLGSFISNVCNTFHVTTQRVCSGLGKSYQKEGKVVLGSRKVDISASEFCSYQMESCTDNTKPPNYWDISLPQSPKPPVKPAVPTKEDTPVMRVLHLSDVHVDRFYKAGSDANCGEPLCCRESSGKPATPEDAAGYWGDYRNCDLPLRTLENMLDHINKTHEIDYVIFTGDFVPHDGWSYTREEVIYLLHTTSQLFQKYLGHVPIFPTLGNHDSSPLNSFPIPEAEDQEPLDWLYDEVEKAWSNWLPKTPTVKLGGYYSVEVYPNFRIISLNMNYCHSKNWWLFLNLEDPAGQLAWLVDQLQMAEDKGEKVHIIGHIPPGVHECFGVWSRNYGKIINRYESTVTGQFFGHQHKDEFEIFYDKSDPQARATSIAYIAPSASTYGGFNPGYRIYTVDGNYLESSWAVLDHETYYMNLTEANAFKEEPKWKLEYSAKEAYGMNSLSPAEWESLVKKFEEDDDLFQKFVRFSHKLSGYVTSKCDSICKKRWMCQLRRSQSNDPPIC